MWERRGLSLCHIERDRLAIAAEVAGTDVVLAAYKRGEIERCRRGNHVDVGPAGLNDLFIRACPAKIHTPMHTAAF